jgi:CheY-like chemotaxis protein
MLIFRTVMLSSADNVVKKNILVVDDDPATAESIKLLLDIDRHLVTVASNGMEALLLFEKWGSFDLVITDYLMPGMLGDELARRIRAFSPAQPILMVTAYVEKLIAAGQPAGSMLGKPWSVDDLRRAVARV